MAMTGHSPLRNVFWSSEPLCRTVLPSSDEVAAKKPAPDVYQLALERLGITAAEAVAFEDSHNGLLSAKAAGLRVMPTPSAYTSDEDFSQADQVIADLSMVDLGQMKVCCSGQLKSQHR